MHFYMIFVTWIFELKIDNHIRKHLWAEEHEDMSCACSINNKRIGDCKIMLKSKRF